MFVSDGSGVVGETGAVGGADLAEDGSGLAQNVRDAEAAANLDQFAAGDEDFAAFGQSVEGQEVGGRAVVHHDCRFVGEVCGASAAFEGDYVENEPLDMEVAAAALAGFQIEFEVRVAAGNLGNMLNCGF